MSDCCDSKAKESGAKPHLVIVGGGSAAFSAALKANELGARVTLINDGLPIGGTCVNVGCVPSKTLIRAAEAQHRAAHPNFLGIESSSRVTDFQAIIAQKSELVQDLRRAKYIDVVSNLPDVRVVRGRARLVAARTVQVNDEQINADRILIATGARPFVPSIRGLEKSGYLTNESAFELEELPESLIVLGGRYVALETAQLFSRLGSRVTVLQRSARILPTEAEDITGGLTSYLEEEGVSVITSVTLQGVDRADGRVAVTADVNGAPRTFQASQLLVATG